MNHSAGIVTLVAACGILNAGQGRAAEVPPGQTGLPPILLKIFEDVTAFSAKAEVNLSGATPSESMQMPMDFFFLEGNMRAEIDMAAVKSEAMPAELVQSLKQIGMDRMVTIMRSGNHPAWVLYPQLKASVEVPPSESMDSTQKKQVPVRESKLGTETVAGQVCDKYKFICGDGQDGTPGQEATVWRARDMARFPVQIAMAHAGGATMVVRFHNIQLKKPSADKFTVPAGYKKHDSMEALMREALQKLLGGQKAQ